MHTKLFIFLASALAAAPAWAGEPASFFDLSATSISGERISFDRYRGKVLLVVNTASRCGFTPQYAELQKLYERYRERGFEILAFPSNDFAGQEPGTNEEIKTFCESRFHITFPLFSRAPVCGPAKQEVFRFLTESCAADFTGEIKWNFEKFLIGRDGRVRARFDSFTNPLSAHLVREIEGLLEEHVPQSK